MVKTRVYVEGGGRKPLNRDCRKAFVAFFNKAGVPQGTVEVEACGARGEAYRTFSEDVTRDPEDLQAILLVDAEVPVDGRSPWQHLQTIDKWPRPSGATDDSCHLMVEVMESWFLADRAALQSFYGNGFSDSALPQNPDVEGVPKQDVLNGLRSATRDTSKGSYNKGSHSFGILESLDPRNVTAASRHAYRLIQALCGRS